MISIVQLAEIQDGLAHSLAALSVQLDAVGALLEDGRQVPKAKALVEQARELAVDGLGEARRAVQALHDGPAQASPDGPPQNAQDGTVLA